MPKVSVAIITYNQRHFVPETLSSVLEQDYDGSEISVAVFSLLSCIKLVVALFLFAAVTLYSLDTLQRKNNSSFTGTFEKFRGRLQRG